MESIVTNKELNGLKQDRLGYEIELKTHQRHLLENLKGDMGKDIQNVLSGKVKVQLPFWQRCKYKIKYILERIFNII